MSNLDEGLRKTAEGQIVSLVPGVYKLPGGAVVPFQVFAYLDDVEGASPDVFFTSENAIHQGTMVLTCTGPEPSVGGVSNGSRCGISYAATASSNVNINGGAVVRNGDLYYVDCADVNGPFVTLGEALFTTIQPCTWVSADGTWVAPGPRPEPGGPSVLDEILRQLKGGGEAGARWATDTAGFLYMLGDATFGTAYLLTEGWIERPEAALDRWNVVTSLPGGVASTFADWIGLGDGATYGMAADALHGMAAPYLDQIADGQVLGLFVRGGLDFFTGQVFSRAMAGARGMLGRAAETAAPDVIPRGHGWEPGSEGAPEMVHRGPRGGEPPATGDGAPPGKKPRRSSGAREVSPEPGEVLQGDRGLRLMYRPLWEYPLATQEALDAMGNVLRALDRAGVGKSTGRAWTVVVEGDVVTVSVSGSLEETTALWNRIKGDLPNYRFEPNGLDFVPAPEHAGTRRLCAEPKQFRALAGHPDGMVTAWWGNPAKNKFAIFPGSIYMRACATCGRGLNVGRIMRWTPGMFPWNHVP